MHNSNNQVDFEILISTMCRTDLEFLNQMFHATDNYRDYNLLIINQTEEGELLTSNEEKIRVINSFERGTGKSRNLAISKSKGRICLIADDDTTYVKDFKETILKAYKEHRDVDFISFEAIDEYSNPYTKYPKLGYHSKTSLRSIYNWMITFKRERLLKHNIYYNEFFGLNSVFRGEEYVFLREAFDKGLKVFHVPKVIVSHPYETSGKLQGNDDVIFSRSAVKYRFIREVAYLWLFKYIFFLIRENYITIKEVPYKFSQGIKGIQKYKALESSEKI